MISSDKRFTAPRTASRFCIRTTRTSSRVACDTALPAARVPVVDLNDIDAIADLLLTHAVAVTEAGKADG